MIYKLTGKKAPESPAPESNRFKREYIYPNYKFKSQVGQNNPLSMKVAEKENRQSPNTKYQRLSLDRHRSQSVRRSHFPSNLKSEFQSRFRRPSQRRDSYGDCSDEKDYRSTLESLSINQKSMDTWVANLKDYIQNSILKNFFIDNLQNIVNLQHLLSQFYGRSLSEHSLFQEHITLLLGNVSRMEQQNYKTITLD